MTDACFNCAFYASRRRQIVLQRGAGLGPIWAEEVASDGHCRAERGGVTTSRTPACPEHLTLKAARSAALAKRKAIRALWDRSMSSYEIGKSLQLPEAAVHDVLPLARLG